MKPLLFFITYNLLDLAMTLAVGLGEWNPVLAWWLATGGPPLMILAKIVFNLPAALLIALGTYYLTKRAKQWLYLPSIALAVVCVWNAIMLIRSW